MSELRIKHRGPNSSYPVSPGTVSPLFDFTESPRATAEAAGEMAHPGAPAHVQVWGRCCSWEQGWEKPKKNHWGSSGPIWHQNSIQRREARLVLEGKQLHHCSWGQKESKWKSPGMMM